MPLDYQGRKFLLNWKSGLLECRNLRSTFLERLEEVWLWEIPCGHPHLAAKAWLGESLVHQRCQGSKMSLTQQRDLVRLLARFGRVISVSRMKTTASINPRMRPLLTQLSLTAIFSVYFSSLYA